MKNTQTMIKFLLFKRKELVSINVIAKNFQQLRQQLLTMIFVMIIK